MIARILVLPGTAQAGSPNHRLAAEATRLLALAEAEVTLLSLADFPLPLFDIELDAGGMPPDHALRLAERLAAQDALLIVSPEHLGAVPPLLANCLAWIASVRRIRSRPVQPFRRLAVGLAGAWSEAAPQRSSPALRAMLLALGAQVLAESCTLANAGQGFDEFGRVREEEARNALELLTSALLDHARALGRHG